MDVRTADPDREVQILDQREVLQQQPSHPAIGGSGWVATTASSGLAITALRGARRGLGYAPGFWRKANAAVCRVPSSNRNVTMAQPVSSPLVRHR